MSSALVRLLKKFVEESMGEVERVVVSSPDGLLLAVSNPSEMDDIIAPLSAALIGGADEAFNQYLSKYLEKALSVLEIVIKFDGQYMIIRSAGKVIICAITRSEPNLGLVYYLLDSYANKIAGLVANAEPRSQSEGQSLSEEEG